MSAWFFHPSDLRAHYAHEYFDEYLAEPGQPATARGGWVFPGAEHPDYYDFLYFSYVIGVAYQTADVELSSHGMRRVALIHCVLALLFQQRAPCALAAGLL